MITTIGKVEALQSLTPNAEWTLRDDGLEWHSTDITQPTDAEIATEISRLQAEFDSNQYQRDRVTDYLDDIFHNGIDGWKATIQLTKDKYPKGGI